LLVQGQFEKEISAMQKFAKRRHGITDDGG
jgi:hypothetical protein